MSDPIKLCCFCKHLEFDFAVGGGGGCETCGFGADEGHRNMVCLKGVWETDLDPGLSDYRNLIRKAETCTHYEPAE